MSAIESTRTQIHSRIDELADAVRDVGDVLEEREEVLAHASKRAARRIDRVARYVEQRDAEELKEEIENIALDHPALFLSGSFTLGLIAARLLRASSAAR